MINIFIAILKESKNGQSWFRNSLFLVNKYK